MKIALFCDSLARLTDFRAAFTNSGHTLLFIAANSAGHHPLRFLTAQIRQGLRAFGLSEWIYLVGALLRGRICLCWKSLEGRGIQQFLARHRPALGLHAAGTLYRRNVIASCGLGILNAHPGALPKYRGRSVMEWSLLCGDVTGVTVFFIDEGIDTGERIVLFKPIALDEIADLDKAKRCLFRQDAVLYREAVDLLAAPDVRFRSNNVSQGLRFYEMSCLFRAALQLSRREASSG